MDFNGMSAGNGMVLFGNGVMPKAEWDALVAEEERRIAEWKEKANAARLVERKKLKEPVLAGTIILATGGEYDSYGIVGLFRAKQDFVPENGLQKALADGALERVECVQWHEPNDPLAMSLDRFDVD